MTLPRLPKPGLARAFDIVTNAVEALEREAIRLEREKRSGDIQDIRAASNAMQHARDIRLSQKAVAE